MIEIRPRGRKDLDPGVASIHDINLRGTGKQMRIGQIMITINFEGNTKDTD